MSFLSVYGLRVEVGNNSSKVKAHISLDKSLEGEREREGGRYNQD